MVEPGNIGYVTTVDSYITAQVKLTENTDVVLNAPDLGLRASGNINPSDATINMDVPSELSLLLSTARVAASLASSEGYKITGFELTTSSDEAMLYKTIGGSASKKVSKSGLGSSAAVAVSATDAILSALGHADAGKHMVHKLAQISHSIATGKVGSGFDIAAATFGSIVYSRYNPSILKGLPQDFTPDDIKNTVNSDWGYTAESLPLPKIFSATVANFVGDSTTTTKMVGSVNDFKMSSPDLYNALIKEMNAHAVSAVDSLKNISREVEIDYNLQMFKEKSALNRRFTKALGAAARVNIEHDEATNLIEESEANGAFIARLPGAGGKDSIAALSVGDNQKGKLESLWRSKEGIEVMKLGTSNSGLESNSSNPQTA